MRTLVPIIIIMILLACCLSACSPSDSAQTLLRGLPLMPEASAPRQSGSMLEYSVPDACSDVAAFYQREMRVSGWTLSGSEGSGDSWQQLEFAKERDSAQIHLSASPVGQAECRVQAFYLENYPRKNSRTQGILAIVILLGIQATFAYLCGHVSMGKGRHPALGWILGFFLGLIAYLFIIGPMQPRRDASGRMIHWHEYKLLTEAEKAAIRSPAYLLVWSSSRLVAVVVVIVTVIGIVLQVLRNLGRL